MTCEEITSDSEDLAPDVATVNIGSGKAIRSWIKTPYKQFAKYLQCVLSFATSTDVWLDPTCFFYWKQVTVGMPKARSRHFRG